MDRRLLMNFDNWAMNEASNVQAKGLLADIEGILGDKYGSLYIVPDFDTFDRPGEPQQDSILIGSSSGVSFALNYDGSKLFSIDFWEKDSTEPDHTIYADGHSLESILKAIAQSGNANEALSTKESPLVLYVDDEDATETKTRLTVVSAPKEKEEISRQAVKPVRTLKGGETNVIPSVSKNPAKQDPELKSEYDYQDPDTIFEDLRVYTNMVIDGTQPSMLVTGMPGVGKTYKITKEFEKAGMQKDVDFFHAKGKATAAGMYQTLWDQNGKLILFDDMDSIFKDDNAVNVLKGALDSGDEREVAWISARPLKTPEGEVIPQKFGFTGRIIFITNLAQKDLPDALKSRSFVIEVALSPEDMVSYIEGMFDKIMPYERVSTKRFALDAIKEAASNNPAVQINMRTFIKATKIVRHVSDKAVALRMIIQQCSYK